MSEKNLSKARGLNSIADPKSFKGSAGRSRLAEVPPPQAERSPDTDRDDANRSFEAERSPDHESNFDRHSNERGTTLPGTDTTRQHPGHDPHGIDNSQPSDSRQTGTSAPERPGVKPIPVVQRKRRELSIPLELADAVERTGVNPADVVMAGLRRYADTIYAGKGARMMAKGRRRLRISISDNEFDQITRLGKTRGWNRSETVSVILSMELFGRVTYPTPLNSEPQA